ncbi:MAG: Rossmann-like domain-containing protein [Dehalococcoidia bacterium]
MEILDEIISGLDMTAEVCDVRQGLFHTAVLTRNCGLAATLPRDALRQEKPSVKEPGFLLEKSVQELVQMCYSDTITEAAIGMATINSLLEVDEGRCQDLNAGDLILEKGKDRKVAIVGHFPFIPRLRELAKQLRVIEKNPREGDSTEAEAEDFIPQADVVGITGTAFTNHTIEHLLNLCAPGAYVVVLGDTDPLSPILFDYGIDAVSGTKVIAPDLAMRCVSEGGTYRQIEGIRKLTMLAK